MIILYYFIQGIGTPGIKECNTPPSSPMLVTKTTRKMAVPIDTDSVDFRDSSSDFYDLHDSMQLGELIELLIPMQ